LHEFARTVVHHVAQGEVHLSYTSSCRVNLNGDGKAVVAVLVGGNGNSEGWFTDLKETSTSVRGLNPCENARCFFEDAGVAGSNPVFPTNNFPPQAKGA